MSHSAKTVVTLVHGTFARRAKWVQSSSLIYRELTKNLPAPVVITTFGWSGRNSASAEKGPLKNLPPSCVNGYRNIPRLNMF